MSVKGRVEAECPKGCEPFEADVWSLVNFEKDPDLKDRLIAGELNLLACESCGELFHCRETVVVMDPPEELLAFVFPESFEAEAPRWKAKMEEDCAALRRGLGAQAPDYEPMLVFGMEAFRAALEEDLALVDEVDVARFLIRSLRLEPHSIRPSVARALRIPRVLPAAPGSGPLAGRLVAGLERLLKENSLLASYQRCLERLKAQPDLVLPAAKPGPASKPKAKKP